MDSDIAPQTDGAIEIGHRVGKLVPALPPLSAQDVSIRILRIEHDGALEMSERLLPLAFLPERRPAAGSGIVGFRIEL